MSITIEVYRDAGSRPGDEIREPLLGSSLEAALARGRAELDARASLRQSTTLDLVAPRPDLVLGQLVAVTDPDQGATWRGKIVSIAHRLAAGAAPTSITIERPING